MDQNTTDREKTLKVRRSLCMLLLFDANFSGRLTHANILLICLDKTDCNLQCTFTAATNPFLRTSPCSQSLAPRISLPEFFWD